MEPDQPCCDVAHAIDEDPAGSAPPAVVWVAVTVPGTWSRDPVLSLDPSVRRGLEAAGVGVLAVRPVTAHREEAPLPGLIVAGTRPGHTWRRDVPVDDAEAALRHLAEPPALARLARGDEPDVGRRSPDPAVVVAVHGDPCAGRRGPAAAAAIAGSVRYRRPGGLLGTRRTSVTVLEAAGLDGARFAPTALVLPWGVALGGLGPDAGPLVRAVQDVFDGRPLVDGYRGRSTYPPHSQVAEAAARRHLAVVGTNAGPDDVLVDGVELVGARVAVTAGSPDQASTAEAGPWLVRLRHSGGRTIRVTVSREATDVYRPVSCGEPPEAVTAWVTEVDADPPTQLWWGPGAGQ